MLRAHLSTWTSTNGAGSYRPSAERGRKKWPSAGTSLEPQPGLPINWLIHWGLPLPHRTLARAIIYAFEKTGLLVTEENQHLLPEKDLAEWAAAIDEYESQQADEELPEEDGNEWF